MSTRRPRPYSAIPTRATGGSPSRSCVKWSTSELPSTSIRKTCLNVRSSQTANTIEMEVVVDAYSPEERFMAWYYYLEERLTVHSKLKFA
ncbi:calcium-binding protein [Cupriavidus necator]